MSTLTARIAYIQKHSKLSMFLGSPIRAMHTTLVLVPLWLSFNMLFFNVFALHPPGLTWFIDHGSRIEWFFRFGLLACAGSAGIFTKSRWVRLASAGVLGVGHAMIACGFYLSNPESLSVGVYWIWAILAAWRIYLEG
jgi:hypothetical protein